MKNAVILIFMVLVAAGCKKDSISKQTEYQTSYRAWLSYKQSVNNSYSYTVNTGSWTGFGTETVINVINGKIVSRSYTAYRLVANPPNGSTKTIVNSWSENAASLNTHAHEGAELLTLDEVYAKAKSVWLAADKKENDVYFEALNNGLISDCGYVPKGCQDDCFTGINISSIGRAL